MFTTRNPEPTRVGLVAGEPMRLEGLMSIFEQETKEGQPPLIPVVGSLEDLLANPVVEHLVIDWNSTPARLAILQRVRRERPKLRLIVIGPDSSDEIIMDTIIAGARAYLDMSAGPRMIRQAIEEVVSGSIWAPRRLLSKLIDRLLDAADGSLLSSPRPHLTAREREVLQLLLLARSNREIATELGIEERTVKAHVGKLMRKTGAENRIELSMRALNGSFVPKLAAQQNHRSAIV